MNNAPLVYILLLIYNNTEAVLDCLASLEKIHYPYYRILLVDNASPDGGGELISQSYPQHEFIANAENLGFARGCNVGIRHALEHGADYVLLLNGDMLVEPDFLEPMVEIMEKDPKAGLASGKILSLRSNKEIWYAGGRIDLWRGKLVVDQYKKPDVLPKSPPIPTRFCTGAMMLIPRHILTQVGLLPEEYFFGVEEWDYSLNVMRHGYHLYFVPEAVAYHYATGSVEVKSIKYHYNFYRNKLIIQRKYLSPPLFWLWKAAFQVYIYLILPVRTPFIHNGAISPRSLAFAARSAIADQKGLNPISLQDILDFEVRLGQYEGLNT